MVPICAVTAAPARPETTTLVSTGPSSRMSEKVTMVPTKIGSPKILPMVLPACKASTMPVNKLVSAVTPKDSTPIMTLCAMAWWNSKRERKSQKMHERIMAAAPPT